MAQNLHFDLFCLKNIVAKRLHFSQVKVCRPKSSCHILVTVFYVFVVCCFICCGTNVCFRSVY